jgi:hypothetical protein
MGEKMDDRDKFSSPQTARIHGITTKALQQWLDRNFVPASIQRSTKQGEPNLFSRNDQYLIRFFKRLTDRGLSRALAGAYVRKFRDFCLDSNTTLRDCTYVHFEYYDDGESARWSFSASIYGTRTSYLTTPEREDEIVASPDSFGEKGKGPLDLAEVGGEPTISSPDVILTVNIVKIVDDVDRRIEELME